MSRLTYISLFSVSNLKCK